MDKRSFIKKLGIASLGLASASSIYAWQVEPFWLEFVKLPMRIKHLPEALEGKTIMQISDIHVGNRFDYNYIIDSFKKAQLFDPDIVVYTGDYVSYESKKQFEQLK